MDIITHVGIFIHNLIYRSQIRKKWDHIYPKKTPLRSINTLIITHNLIKFLWQKKFEFQCKYISHWRKECNDTLIKQVPIQLLHLIYVPRRVLQPYTFNIIYTHCIWLKFIPILHFSRQFDATTDVLSKSQSIRITHIGNFNDRLSHFI